MPDTNYEIAALPYGLDHQITSKMNREGIQT